jgi:hypothetical protein
MYYINPFSLFNSNFDSVHLPDQAGWGKLERGNLGLCFILGLPLMYQLNTGLELI